MIYVYLSVLVLGLSGCAGQVPKLSAPPSVAQQTSEHAAQLFREGSALARAGDLTRAEQYLATALREGHEPETTMRALLSVCVRASRLRSALAYAAPYLTAHPREVPMRVLVASIQLALGDVRSAERELSRVLKHAPDTAEAEFLLATILQRFTLRAADTGPVRVIRRGITLSPRGGGRVIASRAPE